MSRKTRSTAAVAAEAIQNNDGSSDNCTILGDIEQSQLHDKGRSSTNPSISTCIEPSYVSRMHLVETRLPESSHEGFVATPVASSAHGFALKTTDAMDFSTSSNNVLGKFKTE